ncbi:hypothetical protein [Gilvimarinus polysaccharolyticus]|uniref:hypothetical protein n=1 Tax=Gilvimarinus polysaccharolyticus TaxID=863921 RepID=UPI0006735503|nr:hypothetical protein [Gilvimarinus polysaccharolyticus]
MLLQKIKRATLTLVVLVCVFGLVVLLFMQRPVHIKTELPELTQLNPAQLSSSAPVNSAIVSQRPLFWAERKPYVGAAEPMPEAAPKRVNDALDNAELVGVFAAGLTSSVVLKIKKGDVHRVVVDGLYQDWRLVGVSPSSATFIFEGDESQEQPSVKEISLNHREPLPAKWQGKQQNLSEKQ